MSSGEKKMMMKRSGFAQKLLDDLRVRKEQLSVSDNYEYSNKGFKGTNERRSKSTTFQDFNYEGTKPLTSNIEASNQILPYRKGRNMDKLDLSKALSYALENAGKATRGNPSENASIISFFHEVGKRSLGHGTSERKSIQQPSSSTQKHPMVHVHIKELSKGAKKLNHIIKTCSNGLSFRKGKYSITCGEDLIEGAIELEQSLKLLVDIQQASSEYITTKQRRNQIKLLEENDEEEEDVPNHNYRKIRKVAKADIEMRLLAVNYPKQQRQAWIEQGPLEEENKKHRRKTSSFDDTEKKGRIPNVVAKLMGLGEFPEDGKEIKNNNFGFIKSAEDFRSCSVMQENEDLVELKTQRNSKLDLVIHKETQMGNDKAKFHQKENLKGRKRNKVSDKKDGEKTTKNVVRRNSSATEAKLKNAARSKYKLSFDKKMILHSSEEDGSIKKEKFPKERSKGNGETTHYKAEIFEKKTQEISNPNGRFCKVMNPPENKKPNSKEVDGKQDQVKTETETRINSSEDSGVEIKSLNRNVLDHKREIKDDSILLITAERLTCQTPQENQQHGFVFKDVMEQQAPMSKSDGDSERLSKTVDKGTKGELKACLPLLEKQQEHKKTETTEILSQPEINLKNIVVKSQLFIDTANALFKFNIPPSIRHDTSTNIYHQEDKNLILDCGYELMKRKGRSQELSVHPFVKLPISSSKVVSLDHLVRELSKEFEKLRVYDGDYYTRSFVEDYLPQVLEKDVHHKEPNLNSMWDMGWNHLMFAFIEKDDVVRDIERDVFNGLLEEIARDLICI